MQKNGAKLTVFFEEPFWVGLYQRWSGPKLEVAKITFGVEPKDGEVYQFLLEHWKRLSFSPPVEQEIPEERRINPKRARREIQRKELSARPGDEIPAGLGPAAGGSQSVPPRGRQPAQGTGTAGEIPNTPAKAKGKAPRQIKRPRLSFRDTWKGRRGFSLCKNAW